MDNEVTTTKKPTAQGGTLVWLARGTARVAITINPTPLGWVVATDTNLDGLGYLAECFISGADAVEAFHSTLEGAAAHLGAL